jgi:hypothetical protein
MPNARQIQNWFKHDLIRPYKMKTQQSGGLDVSISSYAQYVSSAAFGTHACNCDVSPTEDIQQSFQMEVR